VAPLHLVAHLLTLSDWKLQYLSSTAAPLHSTYLLTALLLELLVNTFLSSIHLEVTLSPPSIRDILRLRSIGGLSSLGISASCAFVRCYI
jgi:hypothetical protein